MKLQKKIILGFVAVAAIGWLLGAAGLISNRLLSNLNSEQSEIRQSYIESAGVLSAHYEWRHALTMAVSDHQEFTGSTDSTACALGKWLASDTSTTDDPELTALFSQVISPHDYIHNEAKTINKMLASGDYEGALHYLEENVLPRTNETIALIGDIQSRYEVLLTDVGHEITALQISVTVVIVILFIVAVAASLLLATIIIKQIMKPIREMTECSKSLAKGDLDIEFNYKIDDEIGHMGAAFLDMTNSMKEQAAVLSSLANGDYTVSIPVRSEQDTVNQAIQTLTQSSNKMLSEIRLASQQVSSGSNQVSQASQDLATGSTEQAATIEELTASASSIQTMAEENVTEAINTLGDIQQAGSLMTVSMESMKQMLTAMKNIDERSQNITKVINVIEDIAFQTNILALNAAVEAARAGQHGKGFAVVADEVRSLASKSAEAAKETSALIVESSQSVAEGNSIVQKVNEGLKEVAVIAGKNAESIEKINNASHQQSTSISELVIGINQINAVVQANSATAEQTAAASEEMSAQATLLNDIIGRYRLNENN